MDCPNPTPAITTMTEEEKHAYELALEALEMLTAAHEEVIRLRGIAKSLQFQIARTERQRRRLQRKVRELEADFAVQEEINGL